MARTMRMSMSMTMRTVRCELVGAKFPAIALSCWSHQEWISFPASVPRFVARRFPFRPCCRLRICCYRFPAMSTTRSRPASDRFETGMPGSKPTIRYAPTITSGRCRCCCCVLSIAAASLRQRFDPKIPGKMCGLELQKFCTSD